MKNAPEQNKRFELFFSFLFKLNFLFLANKLIPLPIYMHKCNSFKFNLINNFNEEKSSILVAFKIRLSFSNPLNQ